MPAGGEDARSWPTSGPSMSWCSRVHHTGFRGAGQGTERRSKGGDPKPAGIKWGPAVDFAWDHPVWGGSATGRASCEHLAKPSLAPLQLVSVHVTRRSHLAPWDKLSGARGLSQRLAAQSSSPEQAPLKSLSAPRCLSAGVWHFLESPQLLKHVHRVRLRDRPEITAGQASEVPDTQPGGLECSRSAYVAKCHLSIFPNSALGVFLAIVLSPICHFGRCGRCAGQAALPTHLFHLAPNYDPGWKRSRGTGNLLLQP